ncbi:Putative serine/threonine-protein kinase, active [Septoria linicola]|uniref:non-specific serine/threonine protein kinase n=1 Tax=Septoria linicola TaxID=215465 RepID=A0A9Q9AM05_9PEZI|nr:putative serine/threonine-protein kinase, active [Septoria linicola]USW48910.1 Putative serine/threonine-protein kinase, active [Septoria linicola]
MSQPVQVRRAGRNGKRKSEEQHSEPSPLSRRRTRSLDGGISQQATAGSGQLRSDAEVDAAPPAPIGLLPEPQMNVAPPAPTDGPSKTTEETWQAKLWTIADLIETTPLGKHDRLWSSFANYFPEFSVLEWRKKYYGEIRPVFLCSYAWDDAIKNASDLDSAQALKYGHTLMVRAVQGGQLKRGIPPSDFLPEKGWYEAILDGPAEDVESRVQLRQRMRDDVEAGKLASITDRSEYLRHAEWESYANEQEDEDEVQDRVNELYKEMESRVLVGESPYTPDQYLFADEWAAEIAPLMDEDSIDAMTEIFEQMVVGVLYNSSSSYSPDQLFKRAVWTDARGRLPTVELQERHDQLWDQCRNKAILSRGEEGMDHPSRAWFNYDWALLEEDCGTLATVKELRDLAQQDVETYFDEFELVHLPGRKPDEMSVGAFLEQVRLHIWTQRRLKADNAWLEKINQTENITGKWNWLNSWQEMRDRHMQGEPLYRPQNIPVPPLDLAAQARQIGSGLDGHWLCRGVLGQGSYGVATIWVRVDSHGRVIDHEVLKDTYMEDSLERNTWDDPFLWDGPVADRIPLEWTLVRELRCIPESENIVEYHAKMIFEDLRMYRIYMEYGDHGTLFDLLSKYLDFGKAAAIDQSGNTLPNNIPLRLAWSIFAELAKALFLAHKGRNPEQAPLLDYDPIVHRDIKGANIFLASRPPALSGTWPDLPILKLADWGLASRKSNTEFMKWVCGTKGYMAPEQCHYDDEARAQYSIQPVSEKSDIYAIGCVMLSLLNLDPAPEQYTYEQEDREWKLTHPNMDVYARTPMLMDLIQDCLKKDPSERPSAEKLLAMIEVLIENTVGLEEGQLSLNKRGREEGEILLWEDSKYLKWAR